MMVVVFFIGVMLLVVAFLIACIGLRGVPIVGRLLRRPTSTVARLREGPVELSGKVMAIGEPVLSISGHRCVAAKTTVSSRAGTGDRSSGTGSQESLRLAPAVRLVDATGTCVLELANAQIVGEHWQSKSISGGQLANVPWVDLIPPRSAAVAVAEELILDGATVLVSGDATLLVTPPETYREGPAEQWVISGSADHLLVIASGGQTRLVVRTLASAVFVLASALYLGVLGAVTIMLAFMG